MDGDRWLEFFITQSSLGTYEELGGLQDERRYQNPRMCKFLMYQFSLVTQSCLTLCDPMDCSTPGSPAHHQLPKFTQTHIHWVGDAIQPSHPLSSPSSPAFNLSQHQDLFQGVGSSHQVAKVLSFSFSISPSNEHSGLICFMVDWLDLLAVQGILNSLLQHYSSKASILRCSAFFIVQLSHPYMTTALTRWTFVSTYTKWHDICI